MRRSERILRQRFGIVRSAAFRSSALSLLKNCSIGLRSGEYEGNEFNSFPAGGFVGPDSTVQARNKIGLGIDNVYEAGEIAEIPRLLLKCPGTACNPHIRTVQFNLIPMGLPIEKHKIDTLTMKMVELSQRGIGPRWALGYAAAARC
jgi:hypothetical protein